jgi:iron complex transport system substrate-binding protein
MDDITGAIVDSAVALHRNPGPGLFEALLFSDLRRRGVHVERQRLIRVSYDGIDIEDAFRADLLVEQCVIVEIKSIARTLPEHTKQLLTYLRLTNLRVGLLLNFGAERMKDGIERVVNNYAASGPSLLRINHPR